MKRRRLAFAALTGLFLAPLAAPSPAAAQENASMATTTLKVGDVAPDFTLLSDQWKPVKLSDYRGKKNVMLAFYVLAFTGG
jgi:cytochrome oxidase Cu insertion factor (SCO1/SenC/PrrC family)